MKLRLALTLADPVTKRGANSGRRKYRRLASSIRQLELIFEAYLPAGVGDLAPGLADCLHTHISIMSSCFVELSAQLAAMR